MTSLESIADEFLRNAGDGVRECDELLPPGYTDHADCCLAPLGHLEIRAPEGMGLCEMDEWFRSLLPATPRDYRPFLAIGAYTFPARAVFEEELPEQGRAEVLRRLVEQRPDLAERNGYSSVERMCERPVWRTLCITARPY